MNTLVQLTDPSFETQTAGKCDLHLEIYPEGMNYAVVDKGQDQLKVLFGTEIISENFKNYFESETALSYHFRKVKISFQTNQFTFIPDELFEKEQLAEYAKFLNITEGEAVFVDHIRSAKCVAVFAVGADLAEMLQKQFHQPQFYHASSAIIEAGFRLSKSSENPMVLLNFQSENFEVVYIQDGKLIFYNILPSRNADEFNYFLLHLMDTLAIQPQETDWVLAGNMPNGFSERLNKYVATFSTADKQSILKTSETFNTLAPADYYSLTALALCE